MSSPGNKQATFTLAVPAMDACDGRYNCSVYCENGFLKEVEFILWKAAKIQLSQAMVWGCVSGNIWGMRSGMSTNFEAGFNLLVGQQLKVMETRLIWLSLVCLWRATQWKGLALLLQMVVTVGAGPRKQDDHVGCGILGRLCCRHVLEGRTPACLDLLLLPPQL